MKTYQELEQEISELKALVNTLRWVIDDFRGASWCLTPEGEQLKKQMQNSQGGGVNTDDFAFFIHPALPQQEAFVANGTLKNAVKKLPLRDICELLRNMEKQGKILHGSATSVYNELVRLGLPQGRGFSFKNFQANY